MPYPVLNFDGIGDMDHRDFEWGEVGLLSVGLHGVTWWLFVDLLKS